jgi:hypothetical protein
MMARSGIGLVDVGLADLLGRVDDAARRRALAAGVRLALDCAGLCDERLDRAEEVLTAGRLGDGPERADVLALVEELDELAWDLQDRAEAGTASQEQYLHAFARARAAAAAGFAFEGDALVAASEGLYEAHHAVQDLAALRAAIAAAVA